MERYLTIMIVAYVAIVAIRNPLFLSLQTLFDMVLNGSGTLILALGVLVVLVSGGIDVSFTAIAIVAGYTSVRLSLATGTDNLAVLIAVAVVLGLLLGAVNGLIVHFFQLPTLIVTLGTSSVFFGAMATTLGTTSLSVSQMPQSMVDFGSANLFTVHQGSTQYGLTVFTPIVVGLVALTWALLYRTMLGRQVFAVGSNPESAARIGIDLFRIRLFAYSYSGLLSGLVGIIYFSGLKFINPTSLVGTELLVIAAVVIGGAKLSGGEGTILGAVLGVVMVQLLKQTLVFLGLDSSYNNLFFGGLLVASFSVMYYQQRQANRKALIFDVR
jgi:simple sugar transport system permease protein